MDIERLDRLESKGKKRKYIIISFVLILPIIIYVYYSLNFKMPLLKPGEYIVSTVEKGNLIQSTRITGQLIADVKHSITAQSKAIVVEVNSRVGSLVKKGEVLLNLKSESLEQELTDSEFDLSEAQARHLLLISELSDQEMVLQSELLNLESNIELETITLEAKEKLYHKNIISELDIREARAKLKSLKKSQSFAELKKQSFLSSKEIKIQAEKVTTNRIKKQLEVRKQHLDELTVIASTDGIVSLIDVEIGQSVTVGSLLIQITRQDRYSALLRVNESQSGLLSYDQKVVMNILNQEVKGKLSRINPTIINNSVEIEVSIIDTLPKGVRPDMSITGEVFFSTLNDVLMISKPYGLKENVTQGVLVINSETNIATKKAIKFGITSVNQAQIISGVQEGDMLIINLKDSQLNKYNQLRVGL